MTDELPNLRDADTVIALLRDAAAALREAPLRKGSTVHLPDHGQLLATGDLHDHGLNFHRILKLAELPSAEDRHVVLHEVIHGPDRVNGADLSVRMLARCADLILRFPGQVHVLQSNHELAQMRGEGITKDGVSVVEIFNDGIDFLYGGAGDEVREAVNDYIGALPLAVKCANGILVSHSLPAPRRIEAFDKGVLDRDLTPEDLEAKGSVYDMVWGRYQNRVILTELAEAWGVSVFVVGHQPVEMGYEALGDNAIIIASDDGHGVGLPIDLSKSYARDELVEAIRPLASVTV
ncbi:MAG: hypothetical protein AAF333_15745 [Planctomycetota bacterium]